MRIFFHLGMPKTGTTALQQSLAAMRGNLAHAGFNYPDGPGRSDEHHILAGMLGDRSALPPAFTQYFATDAEAVQQGQAFASKAVSVAEAKGHHTVVFSTESLIGGDKVGLIKNLGYLNQLASSVVPVFYIREPAALYASRLQQHAKKGKFLLPFTRAYLKEHIQEFEETFGSSAIVRGYASDLLFRNDITADFVANVLGADIAIETRRSNEAMSLEATYLLISILSLVKKRSEPLRPNTYNKLVQEIMDFDRKSEGRQRCDISAELKKEIRQSAIDYKWIRDQYGVEFKDIDYENMKNAADKNSENYDSVDGVLDLEIENFVQYLSGLFNFTQKSTKAKILRLLGI